jgi:GT2 family glycosyltransferase
MIKPIKVLEIELQYQLKDIVVLNKYDMAYALIRKYGKPLGYVTIPLINGYCPASTVRKNIIGQQGIALARSAILDKLMTTHKPAQSCTSQIYSALQKADHPWPLVTVAVCTRDRPALLADCLAALTRLDYPALDLLVIDNAPSTSATAHLVQRQYPHIRYVCEPTPGLNWARNRAITEAHGDILAYTDDDVIVDAHWVRALSRVFAEQAEVMAVTGLVVPYELETEAQQLFERYGGFGRGFDPHTYRVDHNRGARDLFHIHPGKFGTGANMAYRRSVFAHVGPFDPALDVGTVTNGGGDLEMFFRVLQAGHALAYEPSALVRHRHRRDYAQLRTQITDFGIGFYAYLVRTGIAYPHLRFIITRFALEWFWRRNVRRLLVSLMRPRPFPRDLIVAELWGSLRGLGRYPKACRTAAALARAHPSSMPAGNGSHELMAQPTQNSGG